MPEKYRDKDWAKLGVNTEDGFEAVYIVKEGRAKKSVAELKKAMKKADVLLLATDEDREGEAISWHLVELLKPKIPVKRMVFHEITKSAIEEALTNTRDVDLSLVEAQETRRILDRLVGYPLSTLVSKKIKHGLSAGRVQSVAVKIIVDREMERRKFKKGSYWDATALLSDSGTDFEAILKSINGKTIATGKDFDEDTGQIAVGKTAIPVDETTVRKIEKDLVSSPFRVENYSETPAQSSPKPPFTTSTLQQEASRKLRIGARDCMMVAQNLYESGFISYMRTDSTHLSNQAIDAARKVAIELFGNEYVPSAPRYYKKTAKGAQEAHEAIRPSGDNFTHPSQTGLHGREYKLYELIWMRTVACQMNNAIRTQLAADLTVSGGGLDCTFRATGNRIDFPGFMRAYVEGDDSPQEALDDKERNLPRLTPGSNVNCKSIEGSGHETKPPARYTEASLVKALEDKGIGRPSTYASIMGRITTDDRYARLVNHTLIPTFTGMAVTGLLENHFPDLVDLEFTAKFENTLDEIAGGNESKAKYLESFYSAKGAFQDQLKLHEELIVPDEARVVKLSNINAVIKVGRYGPYAEIEDEGETKTIDIPSDIAPADLSEEILLNALKKRLEGPKILGTDEKTGLEILLKEGPYGPYIQLGEPEEGAKKKPRRASLPANMELNEVDLKKAEFLLSLPADLGKHPDNETIVQVGQGRFGPYVKNEKEFRSIKPPLTVFNVTLDEAVALLRQPKSQRGSFTVLRELGVHPDTGEEIKILEGRYGAFLKSDGKNVSIPKSVPVDELTLEKALELIDAKKDKPGRKKAAAKKPAAKKTTAKKPAPKKAAAKKPTAKKAAVKKPAAKKAAVKKPTAKKATVKKPAAK
jgi:DNA topoisomerase-1